LCAVGSTVYFAAFAPDTGAELWKSDGTEGGTVIVKDILPGNLDSPPESITNVGGTVFFRASDGVPPGNELWKSDGTSAGTVVVKTFNSAAPSNLFAFNGLLYFTVYDPALGTVLWKSDGTSDGTVVVTTVVPPGYSAAMNFAAAGSTLFFQGNDGVTGFELWKTDGTP